MKYLIAAFFALPILAFGQSHQEAKSLLNKVYENTMALKSQHIVFTNSIEVPSEGGMKTRTSNGELFSTGEKVRIKTEAFEFLSDGKKAYLIYPEDEEIEETANADETSLSPADILKNYQSGYSYKMAGSETIGTIKVTYILLKPNASEEVKEIMLGIDATTQLLHNYTQFGTNGTNTKFSVVKYEVNTPLNAEMFNINSSEFDGFYKI